MGVSLEEVMYAQRGRSLKGRKCLEKALKRFRSKKGVCRKRRNAFFQSVLRFELGTLVEQLTRAGKTDSIRLERTHWSRMRVRHCAFCPLRDRLERYLFLPWWNRLGQ